MLGALYWATWLLPWLEDLGGSAQEEHMGPSQPIPKRSLGRGVGLVAPDWQDQLFAQPCPLPRAALTQACRSLGFLCSWRRHPEEVLGCTGWSCCPAVWPGNLPDLSEPHVCPVGVTPDRMVLWLRCCDWCLAGLGLVMA